MNTENLGVFAVMKVTIEIPVRNSSPKETFEQMHQAAAQEAEGILNHHLNKERFRVLGKPELSQVVVRS